jgi:phosphohistidine phosphatase
MKRLLLLRHAKSEHLYGINDPDREINSRGKQDSKLMGNWLKANIKSPELILCSTSVRTRMTLDIILRETNWDSKKEYTQLLYLPSAADVLNVLSEKQETIESILVVGHNFGFTDLFNHLSYKKLDNLPTCGFSEFGINKPWDKLYMSKFDLNSFKIPKELK